jgi:hypothetical protein
MTTIADDNELPPTLNAVKSSAFDFVQECHAPDFAFDADNRPTHHTAAISCFCVKYARYPNLRNGIPGIGVLRQHIHALTLTTSG